MENGNKMMSYKKFWVMMLISFMIMYGVMFLNVDSISHVYVSLTRTYMSLLMVAPMAVVMMPMMGGMYPDKRLNKMIIAGAIIVFVTALVFLRNQVFISDAAYMRAMIPHHSSALMTSKNAHLKDAETIRLSKSIIRSQEQEIAIMKERIKQLK